VADTDIERYQERERESMRMRVCVRVCVCACALGAGRGVVGQEQRRDNRDTQRPEQAWPLLCVVLSLQSASGVAPGCANSCCRDVCVYACAVAGMASLPHKV
jgi:hypothetical protein